MTQELDHMINQYGSYNDDLMRWWYDWDRDRDRDWWWYWDWYWDRDDDW